MHTIWKGAVSFGLVHIPVKLYSATEEKEIAMKYVHRDCGAPVQNVRHCPACQTDVEWEQIIRGYEIEKNRFVLFEKEELDDLLPETNKELRIVRFVEPSDIDPVYYHKTYYLGPGELGTSAYTLFAEALRSSGKIAIGQIAIRSKVSLAAIRICDGCLVMETMFYPDEVRQVQQVPNMPEQQSVGEKELAMAQMLISHLSGTFDPAAYPNEYRLRLIDAIERKMAGEDIRTAPPAASQSGILDLMSALQASLEAVTPAEPPAPSGKSAKPKAKRRAKQASDTAAAESAS
ncbi:Ku protein [Paenibacillus doosanensis]|uniref:Non-homologous end joining protein Ku n=1 Tax=Paenibacillus konkukensis TaxID=2020716 RepID=A0ABY4RX47_9BACL|nr:MULTISPECIES: Ku protein [Paenibacillus]MCS7458684.1 Ku protein [Paenibacillus doosanensis]UQZ86793.1 putative DNA repair protein YkoV [Paenibacillus konkukensis]